MSRKSSTSAAAFRKYEKSYKHNNEQLHRRVFQQVQDRFGPFRSVLYPGCHRHITASLIFPKVTYIDSDRKVSDIYQDDETVDEWIETEKSYKERTKKRFICANYETNMEKYLSENNSFDLLISLSAGIVSTHCVKYLSENNGYLLVNDSHCDARTAFLNPQLELVAVWKEDSGTFSTEPSELKQHFHYIPKKQQRGRNSRSTAVAQQQQQPQPMTKAMVDESIRIGTKSKRSFRLGQKEAHFYIFRRCRPKQQQLSPSQEDDDDHHTAKKRGTKDDNDSKVDNDDNKKKKA